MATDTAPRLQAEESGPHQWRVWCRYCGGYHYHGKVAGHRVAHCVGTTPYTETGYEMIAPKKEGVKVKRTTRRSRR